jgi:hypothetical protein
LKNDPKPSQIFVAKKIKKGECSPFLWLNLEFTVLTAQKFVGFPLRKLCLLAIPVKGFIWKTTRNHPKKNGFGQAC